MNNPIKNLIRVVYAGLRPQAPFLISMLVLVAGLGAVNIDWTGPGRHSIPVVCTRTSCYYTGNGWYNLNYYGCHYSDPAGPGGSCGGVDVGKFTAGACSWPVGWGSLTDTSTGGPADCPDGNANCVCSGGSDPPATVSGPTSCTGGSVVHGWCNGVGAIHITADEPVDGYTITAIETDAGLGLTCSGLDTQHGAACDYTFPEGVTPMFHFWADSSYGDQSGEGSAAMSVDTGAPTVGYLLSGGTPGGGGWYLSGPVTMTCTGSDALSGLFGITYGTQTATATGSTNLSCTATDNAGNTASTSATVQIDNVAPAVSLLCNGSACSSGWYGKSATLTAAATDALSGVAAGSAMVSTDGGATWSASAAAPNGVNTILVRAFDVAGNMGTGSGTVRADTTLPAIAFDYSGILCAGGWYNTPVQVSIEAHDLFSGITSYGFSVNGGGNTLKAALTADGIYSLKGFATNGVGTTATIGDSVRVDSTPPFSAWVTGNNSWVGGSVALQGTSTDFMAGISNIFVSIDNGKTWISVGKISPWSFTWDTTSTDIPVPDGAYTILARADDNACNHEHTARLVVNVDNTPPTLKLQDSFILLGRSTQIFNSDVGSGMDRAVATISGNGIEPVVITFGSPGDSEKLSWDGMAGNGKAAPFGTYTVVVDAWDKVGNHSTTKGTWVRPVPQAPTIIPLANNSNAAANNPGATPGPSVVNPSTSNANSTLPAFLPLWLLVLPMVGVMFWLLASGVALTRDRRGSELRALSHSVNEYLSQRKINSKGGEEND